MKNIVLILIIENYKTNPKGSNEKFNFWLKLKKNNVSQIGFYHHLFSSFQI